MYQQQHKGLSKRTGSATENFCKIQALLDQQKNALLGVTAKCDSNTVTGTLKALQN